MSKSVGLANSPQAFTVLRHLLWTVPRVIASIRVPGQEVARTRRPSSDLDFGHREPGDSSWRVPTRWCPIRLSTSHSIWPTSGALSPWRSRLTKRAPSYFPPSSRGSVEIGNLSLVQVIRAMQTQQAAFVDPREKMLEEQREQQALADLEQGIISMVPEPAHNLPA